MNEEQQVVNSGGTSRGRRLLEKIGGPLKLQGRLPRKSMLIGGGAIERTYMLS